MGFFSEMNERVKRFGILEMKLAQGAAMGFTLVLAKLFPEIMTISLWWFVLFALLCAIRPLCVFYGRTGTRR
jgi:hypothetical protein